MGGVCGPHAQPLKTKKPTVESTAGFRVACGPNDLNSVVGRAGVQSQQGVCLQVLVLRDSPLAIDKKNPPHWVPASCYWLSVIIKIRFTQRKV
jgi:hypothetical protein